MANTLNTHYEFSNNGVDISIPYTAYDLKYWDYLCAKSKELEVLEGMKEEGISQEQKAILAHTARVIFCDYALKLPDGVSSGDIIRYHTPQDIDPNTDLYSICITSRTPINDISLIKIYYHFNNMVDDYTNEAVLKSTLGESLKFWYREECYKISSVHALNPNGMTANELIQTLEVQRLGQPKFIVPTLDEEGQVIGEELAKGFNLQQHHATMCRQVAILARKEGEELETNPLMIERFIDRRAEYFKDLPFNVIRDIDFFLTGLVMNFQKMVNSHTSLQGRPKLKRGQRKHRANLSKV